MEAFASFFYLCTFAIPKNKTMLGKFQKQLQDELASIEDAGLYKKERII